MKSKLFSLYCCSFYGAPLWPLQSTAVQQICTDWRKALRSLWNVSPRTHCDIIAALANQMPLIITLEKRFIRFIVNNLCCANPLVIVIA